MAKFLSIFLIFFLFIQVESVYFQEKFYRNQRPSGLNQPIAAEVFYQGYPAVILYIFVYRNAGNVVELNC